MWGNHFIHFILYTLHPLYTIYTVDAPATLSYTFYTLYITHTREKGKFAKPKREKGKLGVPKREKGKGRNLLCDPIPLGNKIARTHARTHSTTRNDFPVGLTPTTFDFSYPS